jgi:thiopeptide-type bacteriocin biosynthesis protein
MHAPVKDTEGNVYNNQFVAALIRNTPAYVEPGFVKKKPLAPSVIPGFSLGSEWVYLKIFCGPKAADKILVDGLRPLVQQLEEEGIIDKFFFLRHNKGGLHLRTRFHLANTSLSGRLMQLFHEHIGGFEASGLAWKIESDTYKRELDRYGANAIELAESIFYYDSIAVLDMLHVTEGTDREEARWLWAIRAIDEFLDSFGLQPGHKLTFIEITKNLFHKEYHANAMLIDQLSAKYRNYKSRIETINDRSKDADSPYAPIFQVLQQKKQRQAACVHVLMKMHTSGTLDVALLDLLPSYVHMLVNRIIPANPRLHELVLYDMLFMYYRSQLKRGKQPNGKDIKAA